MKNLTIVQKAVAATILGAVLWSTAGLFIKVLTLDAFTILFYRSIFSAGFFLIIFREQLFRYNRLMLLSVGFYVPLLILFVTSTKLTTAANSIFLQYTAPAFVLLLEPVLLRTKLTRLNSATILICFFGMILFFFDDFTAPEQWLGILLAALSGLMLTGLIITQKMNKAEYHTAAVFWGNVMVCVATLPWMMQSTLPDTTQLLYLIYLGCGQLGLGYILFLYGQRHLPAVESSIIAMLEPILNPVWVLIGYGEQPSVFAVTGGLIIISAISFRIIYSHFAVK